MLQTKVRNDRSPLPDLAPGLVLPHCISALPSSALQHLMGRLAVSAFQIEQVWVNLPSMRKGFFLTMMCILKKKGKDSFLNTSLLVVMVSGCNIHGSGVQGDVEA